MLGMPSFKRQHIKQTKTKHLTQKNHNHPVNANESQTQEERSQQLLFHSPLPKMVPFNCSLYDSWRVIFATRGGRGSLPATIFSQHRSIQHPASSTILATPTAPVLQLLRIRLLPDQPQTFQPEAAATMLTTSTRVRVHISAAFVFPCRQCLSTIQNHLSALSALLTEKKTRVAPFVCVRFLLLAVVFPSIFPSLFFLWIIFTPLALCILPFCGLGKKELCCIDQHISCARAL